ncbi:AMP-binding enzyme [Xylariomycetidae sp. FL0641]|nr:AMP-binding enzyme [Xylariomycetidae sp. FL0641]
MVVESRWKVDIPICSLQKWVFGSSFGPLPEKAQFIDPERPDSHVITQAGYRLRSKRIALGLQKAGLKPGNPVLLFSGNNLFTPTIFMGIQMAGGIFTGANPSFVARELAHQLRDSGAYILIAAEKSMGIALEAAAEVGLPRDRIYSFDDTAFDKTPGESQHGVRHWTSLHASEEEAAKFDWIEPVDPKETTCCLNYSSGTTGVPKGVEISHHSYVANGVAVEYMAELEPGYQEKKKRARQLAFLPMYHAYGQTYYMCNYPKFGMPVYVMPSFDFEKMLQHIERFKITGLMAVPPIMVLLAKNPATKRYDLSSIEEISCGAAPLGLEVMDEVAKQWPEGKVTPVQGWGMSELTCSATGWVRSEIERSPAVGEANPNSKIRIVRVDGGGEITAPHERGELWVSSPMLMRGYWRNPAATAATVHVDAGDGSRWLKTGDIAEIDRYAPGGKLRIVDRLKELIKVKGNQVAPAELEALLLDNPCVNDVGVVGVTIRGEEVPRAYVVPNPEKPCEERDIAEWMMGKVVRYKYLRGGVKFIDVIPKNPSGKILRKQLRDRAAKEVGDRTPTASKLA